MSTFDDTMSSLDEQEGDLQCFEKQLIDHADVREKAYIKSRGTDIGFNPLTFRVVPVPGYKSDKRNRMTFPKYTKLSLDKPSIDQFSNFVLWKSPPKVCITVEIKFTRWTQESHMTQYLSKYKENWDALMCRLMRLEGSNDDNTFPTSSNYESYDWCPFLKKDKCNKHVRICYEYADKNKYQKNKCPDMNCYIYVESDAGRLINDEIQSAYDCKNVENYLKLSKLACKVALTNACRVAAAISDACCLKCDKQMITCSSAKLNDYETQMYCNPIVCVPSFVQYYNVTKYQNNDPTSNVIDSYHKTSDALASAKSNGGYAFTMVVPRSTTKIAPPSPPYRSNQTSKSSSSSSSGDEDDMTGADAQKTRYNKKSILLIVPIKYSNDGQSVINYTIPKKTKNLANFHVNKESMGGDYRIPRKYRRFYDEDAQTIDTLKYNDMDPSMERTLKTFKTQPFYR